MKRKRMLTWSLLLGLLVSIGTVCWYCQATGAPRALYQTSRVEKGEIAAKVTASGTVSALVTVSVGSQVSGRIKTLTADFNSPVAKGQILATIDSQLFQAEVAQAQANYQAAEARVTQAKVAAAEAERQYGRAKGLEEKQLAAAADRETAEASWRTAQAEVKAAEAGLSQARAALHQAQVNLEYTRIVSPIDGVVISRSVDVGQTVAASFTAPVLFTIAEDLRRMQVDASVAEADVGKLKTGMEARFVVDAFPDEPFTGVIRQVRLAPQTSQNVVTYDTVVDVANEQLKLMPGMTANITFVYDRRENALRIPNTALRYRPADGEKIAGAGSANAVAATEKSACGDDCRTLWVLRGETPEPIQARLGLSDGVFTEVMAGDLREGDALVTGKTEDGQDKAAAKSSKPGGPPRPF